MAFIHTILLNFGAKETRKSENRRYVACAVATVTERAVALQAESKAKVEAALVDWRGKLAERTAKHGMTVEQAKTWGKAASERWYNEADGIFETERRIRSERNLRYQNVTNLARADLVARGFADPYDKESPYGIEEAANQIGSGERTLASWKPMRLGAEHVLSWHLTVQNAGKQDRSGTTARGYRVSIRTDFEVRETAKRAAKTEGV